MSNSFKKLYATYLRGKSLEADEVSARRDWMEAVAKNASRDTLHYFVCKRTIKWFREQLDKAEKDGNKYVRLVDLMLKIEGENEQL